MDYGTAIETYSRIDHHDAKETYSRFSLLGFKSVYQFLMNIHNLILLKPNLKALKFDHEINLYDGKSKIAFRGDITLGTYSRIGLLGS